MKIIGLGACIIRGFPHGEEFSFFNLFIEKLKKKANIESKIISLDAFTIDRAEKYVFTKILPLNPDIVILQFGTTGTSIDFWNNLQRKFHINVKSEYKDQIEKKFSYTSGLDSYKWTLFRYIYLKIVIILKSLYYLHSLEIKI